MDLGGCGNYERKIQTLRELTALHMVLPRML